MTQPAAAILARRRVNRWSWTLGVVLAAGMTLAIQRVNRRRALTLGFDLGPIASGPQGKRMKTHVMLPGQSAPVLFAPKNDRGESVDVQDPTFSVDDPSVADFYFNGSERRIGAQSNAIPTGESHASTLIHASGDADLGEGVTTITEDILVIVTNEATTLGFDLGENSDPE